MDTPLTGELTRHQNQPFYAQKQSPRFFWGGCLIPAVVIAVIGFFILRGVSVLSGFETVRLFLLVVIIFSFIQMILGGAVFAKTRSSLGKGLLLGAFLLLLLLAVAFIGLVSTLGSFLN